MPEQPQSSTDLQALQQELLTARLEIIRLQAEAAQAQVNYKTLFDNAGDSIFIIDLASYTIQDLNAHAARRLGYHRDELIGQSLDDIEVTIDDNQMQLAWVSKISSTHIYECFYRHKDGHLIPVEVSSRIVKVNGRDFILNFVRNIEARKQMEAEREQLIADLDSFAETVAHDIKSPLSTVYSYTVLLEDMADELAPTDLKEHLHFMRVSSHRAIQIVNELLLLASVRNQDQVERSILDMATILDEVQERLAESIASSGAIIHLPDAWPAAWGYGPWIAEIWVNYISNAIKYGGTPPIIELGSTIESKHNIRFWVRDNGAGIEPDDLPRLFRQFSRLDVERVQGHGLGLSIVKRIAEKLEGSVGVESMIGEGSTFSFTLPNGALYT